MANDSGCTSVGLAEIYFRPASDLCLSVCLSLSLSLSTQHGYSWTWVATGSPSCVRHRKRTLVHAVDRLRFPVDRPAVRRNNCAKLRRVFHATAVARRRSRVGSGRSQSHAYTLVIICPAPISRRALCYATVKALSHPARTDGTVTAYGAEYGVKVATRSCAPIV